MNVDLVPVTRPDGRIYKPRKRPVAELLDNSDSDWRGPEQLVYVLRTHDIERARSLAERVAVGYELKAPLQTWTRLTIRRGEPEFEYDAVRGVPVVIFEAW